MVVSQDNHSEMLLSQTIPEPTRTIVLMALLGIALLGVLIVVSILLGGHWVRRLGGHRRGPSVPLDRRLKSRESRESAPPPNSSRQDINEGDTLGPDDMLGPDDTTVSP